MSQKNRGKKGGQTRTAKKPQGGGTDKTFGMKNKKGKAAQKIVKSVQGANNQRRTTKKKDDDDDLANFVRSGYTKPQPKGSTTVQVQTPEEIKKSEKANPFIDLRRDLVEEDKPESNSDSIQNWDQEKLSEVVNKKANNKPTSDKICQYFQKAIEEEKYGWFWECPNGDDCPYRHALPPDYVFKSKEKKKVEVTKSLEEIIEERRATLNVAQGTPVNEKTFKEWKDKKIKEKRDKEAEALSKRKRDIKEGNVKLNGREILTQQIEDKKFFEEEGGEETFDLSVFLKQKTDQEDELDKENFKVISEIQSQYQDYVEPTEDELSKLANGNGQEQTNTITVSNENNTVTITTGNDVKVQIDSTLFDDDINIDDIDEDK